MIGAAGRVPAPHVHAHLRVRVGVGGKLGAPFERYGDGRRGAFVFVPGRDHGPLRPAARRGAVDGLPFSPAEIQRIRRDFHAHPELRFEERRTSDLVAKTLAGWGIDVHRGLGGTGVVGVIRNGSGRKSLGLRADMDALPIQEANTFAHASTHAGKMRRDPPSLSERRSPVMHIIRTFVGP